LSVPNLRRVERAAKRYGEALGRGADVAALDGLAARAHGAYGPAFVAELELARRGGVALLERAVAQREAADRGVEAAIEVLRHCGRSPSWAELGAVLGLTAQGAHKRYRHVEDVERELTIDDALEGRV
jgi:hypothetical protein